MPDDIVSLRDRINQLDEQLVRLLNERATVALKLGDVKISSGKQIYDPVREREVIAHVDALNEGPLNKGAVEELFAAIITACREIQIR